VSVWSWFQKFDSCQFYRRKRIFAFIIDESMVQIGYKNAWIGIAIEQIPKSIPDISISKGRNMVVVESFIHSLVNK
jgi:putative transposase